MKNFKKFLSAALSAALIAVTAVGGIGATAETSEIEGSDKTVLHPLYIGETGNGSDTVIETVTPIDGSTVKGIKMTAKGNGEYKHTSYIREDISAYNGIMAQMVFATFNDKKELTKGAPYSLEGTDGFIVYIKTTAANRIMVAFNVDNEMTYTPEMTLVPNTQYEYLELGGTEWKTATTGYGSSAKDEESNTVAKGDSFGTLDFEGAFEGYVKFPYSKLTNDYKPKSVDSTKNTLASVYFKTWGLGGDYGEVTVAPVFLYEGTGDATEFEYAATEITPIAIYNNYNNLSEITKTSVQPIGATIARGMLIASSDGNVYEKQYVANGSDLWAKYCCYGTVNNETGERSGDFYSLSGTAGLVFYVKLDGANKVFLNFAIDDNTAKKYAQETTLQPGSTYAYLEIGSDTWQTGTAVVGATNSGVEKTNMFGVMNFDKAFEGYVKIPYKSLVADGTSVINAATMKMAHIDFKLGGIGGKYGNAVLGPVSLYSEEPFTSNFTYPTEWQSSDINAKAVTRYEMKHFNWRVTEEVADISALGLNGVALKFKNDDTKSTEFFASSKAYTQMLIKNSTEESKSGTEDYNGKMFELPSGVKTSGALIIYVKTPAANKMCLYVKSVGQWSYFEDIGLRKDGTYYTLKNGEISWQQHKSTEYIGDLGLIEFDDAFEGYIKIPTSSVKWSGTSPYKLGRVEVRFAGLGGDYGDEIIMSPLMYTEQDSPSTTINITRAFEDGDVDRSGTIDSADLALCRQYLLTSNIKPSNVEANGGDADVNYDGVADVLDLVRLKKILVNKAG